MHTLTHIGVINTEHKHHIDFAITALTYKQQIESGLAYELWSQGEDHLALITQQRADMIIYEMQYLKLKQ